MKKYILLLSALILSKFAYSQNWQWIKQAGSTASDSWGPAFHDLDDNIYVSGGTNGNTFYFGSDSLVNVNGIIFAKYDVNGNELWIKKIQTTGTAGGRFIYDSYSNDIVLFGSFSGTLTCDTFSIGPTFSEHSVYVAKFDLNGNCLWLKSIFTAWETFCISGAVDDNGNIFIAPASSNSFYGVQDTILAGGNIVKLSSNGIVLWAKKKISTANVPYGTTLLPYQMKISNGLIYISGETYEDTLTIDTVSLAHPNQYGVVVSCFDMNADVQWVKLFATPAGQGGLGLEIDSSGNIYTVGHSYSVAHFDNDSLLSPSYPAGFITKLDHNGNYVWKKNIPAISGNSNAYTINTTATGETYVTGHFMGTAIFGNDTIASSDTSMFISRYYSNGDLMGVRTFGKATGYAVITLSDESPVVGGKFKSNITVGTTTLTSYGNWDAYVARLDAFTGIDPQPRLAGNQLIIYANPNNGKCNITIPDEFVHEKNLILSIYDNTGKLIQQKTLEIDDDKIRLNLDSEAKGIYIVTLSNGVKSFRGKIVFE